MEQLTEQKPARKRSRGKNPVLAAFLLGIVAGAAAMFCAGFLYLRQNLILSYEFPGLMPLLEQSRLFVRIKPKTLAPL